MRRRVSTAVYGTCVVARAHITSRLPLDAVPDPARLLSSFHPGPGYKDLGGTPALPCVGLRKSEDPGRADFFPGTGNSLQPGSFLDLPPAHHILPRLQCRVLTTRLRCRSLPPVHWTGITGLESGENSTRTPPCALGCRVPRTRPPPRATSSPRAQQSSFTVHRGCKATHLQKHPSVF